MLSICVEDIMLYFKNDYSEGMHPSILQAIQETNTIQQPGYGLDLYCQEASRKIKIYLENNNAEIHYFVGGTQTNLVAISAFLRPVEAIIATDLSHIHLHETGAIENCGHQIILCPHENGKLTSQCITQVMHSYHSEHMVIPKLVFISNATELGSVYTKDELQSLYNTCKQHNLLLYIDGARLACALSSTSNDLHMKELCALCDAFYIGGTKNGAMFGEALVITNPALQPYMRHYIKQKGALLAKGRYLGLQFSTLFTNNLYLNIAKHANTMANKLYEGMLSLGYTFLLPCESNLLFAKLDMPTHEYLSKHCHYEVEIPHHKNYVEARFVTSFMSKEEDIDALLDILKEIKTSES